MDNFKTNIDKLRAVPQPQKDYTAEEFYTTDKNGKSHLTTDIFTAIKGLANRKVTASETHYKTLLDLILKECEANYSIRANINTMRDEKTGLSIVDLLAQYELFKPLTLLAQRIGLLVQDHGGITSDKERKNSLVFLPSLDLAKPNPESGVTVLELLNERIKQLNKKAGDLLQSNSPRHQAETKAFKAEVEELVKIRSYLVRYINENSNLPKQTKNNAVENETKNDAVENDYARFRTLVYEPKNSGAIEADDRNNLRKIDEKIKPNDNRTEQLKLKNDFIERLKIQKENLEKKIIILKKKYSNKRIPEEKLAIAKRHNRILESLKGINKQIEHIGSLIMRRQKEIVEAESQATTDVKPQSSTERKPITHQEMMKSPFLQASRITTGSRPEISDHPKP